MWCLWFDMRPLNKKVYVKCRMGNSGWYYLHILKPFLVVCKNSYSYYDNSVWLLEWGRNECKRVLEKNEIAWKTCIKRVESCRGALKSFSKSATHFSFSFWFRYTLKQKLPFYVMHQSIHTMLASTGIISLLNFSSSRSSLWLLLLRSDGAVSRLMPYTPSLVAGLFQLPASIESPFSTNHFRIIKKYCV